MIGTEGALARMTLRLSKPSERSVTGGRWTQNRVFATLPLVVFLALSALATGADKPATAGTPQDSAAPQPQVNIETRKKADKDLKVESRPADIKVTSTLVLINVTVTDPLNRFVTGLERDNFRLFEDKKEQSISAFSSEDAPISIGLVFDTSGSMGAKLQKSREAAADFFQTANPDDEFFLVRFNDRPELAVGFTKDTDKIQSALTFTQSKGRTALLDGVYMAMNEMKKARNPRKALLIISDGGDNSSRYTESEIKNAVREGDVQIYAIGIFEPAAGRGRTPEEAMGPGLLSDLAEQTGGRAYAVDNPAELPDIAAKIGVELRNQYILGYTPKNQERDGKYRRVQVKLVQPRGLPPLRAIYRLGYYAPSR
jgi:Ca-activated chloride channel homolog